MQKLKKGQIMLRKKIRRSLVYPSTILTVLVGPLLLLPVSILRANSAPDSTAGSEMFRTKCAMCHGQDGAGSAVGKSMNVPDLRSPIVQKLPDAELAQVISSGRGGMPSFKSSLSDDQIHALVTHIRSLHQKK
jgi:cytochrome c6